ncbi:NADPH-dependent FMN reductase [Streptomyces pactum]|uniref:NADPH-dependent FMN reductase n=1 Tax=Streptomyces pactum TaxID=68249 RepID=UPI0018D5B264|nr:NAD(P)H-dependent oxidoreductase [Streptomyces pactum]
MLGFAGSLRTGSYNRMLLEAARELAPERMSIGVFDLKDIPLYNYDVEERGDPEPVAAFKRAIADADALLIATPEYQQGIPGVLKNALDWASRPPRSSALQDKPVAIMGATPGMTATARAQVQLRQALAYNSSYTVLQPEVLVGRAHERFDEDGRLTDETAGKLIRQLLLNLADLTRRLRTP